MDGRWKPFFSLRADLTEACVHSARGSLVGGVFCALGPYIMRSELQGGCWVLCLRCRFRHIKKTFWDQLSLSCDFLLLSSLSSHSSARMNRKTGERYRAVPARLPLKNPTAELMSNSWASTPFWLRRQQNIKSYLRHLCSGAMHWNTSQCTTSSADNEGMTSQKERRHQRKPSWKNLSALTERCWLHSQHSRSNFKTPATPHESGG